MSRKARLDRRTHETDIHLALDLDDPTGVEPFADGGAPLDTGVGFFDHMLSHVAKHGRLGLAVACRGDTHIDDHHTVEDVGIVLGQALAKALGDKRGIERYGHAAVPMDETLARCALDLSGRAALVFRVQWTSYAIKPGPERSEDPDPSPHIVGSNIPPFDVQLVQEFFNAVAQNAKMNLHLEVPWGDNNHHIAEGLFKAFGRALHMAKQITHTDMPSTKGSL
jgi:imidazoleglycerol-phosphate dehydratase